MSQQYEDPFAVQERHPAVSWKDKPVGSRIVGKVLERPALVQSRDFETGERATWEDGNPKMSVVTVLEVNGEKLSLWAPKPSAMFAAIAQAQQDAGAQLAPGGTLTVEYTGDKPNEKNPRLNPQKQYRAKYDPPSAFDQPQGQQQSGGWGGAAQDAEPPF